MLTGLAVVWWLVGVLVSGVEVGQNVGVHVGPQDLVLTGQHRHGLLKFTNFVSKFLNF